MYIAAHAAAAAWRRLKRVAILTYRGRHLRRLHIFRDDEGMRRAGCTSVLLAFAGHGARPPPGLGQGGRLARLAPPPLASGWCLLRGPEQFSGAHHIHAARSRGGFCSGALSLRAAPVTRMRTVACASTTATVRRGFAADADDAAGASGAKQTASFLFDLREMDVMYALGELDRKLRGASAHNGGGSSARDASAAEVLELLDLVRDNHTSKAFGPVSVLVAYTRLRGFMRRGFKNRNSSKYVKQHNAHPAFALLGEAAVRFAPVMDARALSMTLSTCGQMASRGLPVNVHEGQALSAEVVRAAPQMSARGLHSSSSQLNLSQFWSLKPQLASTSKLNLSRFCDLNTQPSPPNVLTTY